MYAHSNVVILNQSVFKMKVKRSIILFNKSTQQSTEKQIQSIQGTQIVNTQDLTDHIASYKAEQSPLK